MKIFKAMLPSFIILLLSANVSALYAQTIPSSFSWSSTGPIINPKSDATHNIIAVKDPSTVFYNGQYIVYASTANSAGNWGMEYLHFTSWSTAGAATPYFMDNTSGFSGYHTAPQVFYFAPQNKWYLIFQSGQPQYSTNSDPTQPQNWTVPKNFFASQPSNVSNWIDFWIICDSTNAYLFFTGDNGNFYRSSTSLANFPNGFGNTTIVYSEANQNNLFEADNVYTVEGSGTYLANIECIGSDGHRFFRALTAPSLGGAWTPLGNTANLNTPFLGAHNVTFNSGVSNWTSDFSSGGAVIDGDDQTDSINLNNLTFLYQGDNPNNGASSYALIPWSLGLASSKANTTLPTATPTKTNTPAAPTNTPTKTNTPLPPMATFTATRTVTPIVSSTWRVNAGGQAYTDSLGNVWSADENYSGGSTVAEGGAVTGTNDSTLYDTQRYGTFSYSFNVPAGSYQVTLKLAETYSGDMSTGARIFNISINGTAVVSSLDIFSQVGGNTADDKVINNVLPSGGVITIQFASNGGTDANALVQALQVIPQPATPTMTRTNTPVPPTSTSTATFTPTRTNTAIPPTATFTFTSTSTATKTNTPVPPTNTFTAVPPTATRTSTPVPPTATNTSVPPTATSTNSPAPPTATFTAAPPTATFTAQPPTMTFTAVPPTNTATNTPVPPTVTDTPVPPTATLTNTPAPPTATFTAVPPTATFTSVPPTNTPTQTPVPPTATSTNTPLPPTTTFTAVPPTATRTATPVPPTATNTAVPPTSTPTVVTGNASFTVQLLSGVQANVTNSPHPQIQIVNTGTAPLALNNVTVKYWFNCDCTNQTIQTWVDWAGLMPSGSTVTGNIHTSVQATTQGGQTDAVVYSFTGNMVLQPGQAIQIQSRFNKSDWSNMMQSNDYSFAANSSFVNDSHATGYLNGALVWGQEPAATSAALVTASVLAFPNPSTGNGVNIALTLSGSGTGTLSSLSGGSVGEIVDPNANITLKVYTLAGRLIWSTTVSASTFATSGSHTLFWDEKNYAGNYLANGLYFLTATVTSQGQSTTATSRILILK